MKESLNFNTFFNTLAMIRPEIDKLMLVVEGDDDYFYLQKHASQDLYVIMGVGGKPVVLDAAIRASASKMTGIRSLVDRDLDPWVVLDPGYPDNVIVSQNHDVFMDLILCDQTVIENVIETAARKIIRKTKTPISPSSVVAASVDIAAKIAPLRVANESNSLGLKLRNFPFGSLTSLQPSRKDIATLVAARSSFILSKDEIVSEIVTVEARVGHLRDGVVGDHDFFNALARVLKSHEVRTSAEVLFDSFLTALSCASLMKAVWFEQVNQWCATHARTGFSCDLKGAGI